VPGASDVRDFVDALLGARKVLAGVADWQPDAVEGVFRYVRAVEYQGEIAGELTVKAYPRRPTLRFRIILTVGRAIWRLDYSFDDAPHVNSHNRPADLTGTDHRTALSQLGGQPAVREGERIAGASAQC
jgi:hypothetical protein